MDWILLLDIMLLRGKVRVCIATVIVALMVMLVRLLWIATTILRPLLLLTLP